MRDVRVSTLPPSALVTALEKGDIEGATLYEPYLTETLKTGRIKVLFRPGDVYQHRYGEPFLALVIAGRKEFIEKERVAVAKFIGVMEQTLTSLPNNLDPAAKALLEVFPDIKGTDAEAKELLVPYAPNIIKSRNDAAFVKKAQNLYDRLLDARQIKEPVKAADFWIIP
jgi:phthalate transport system substrate-binding protein